MLALAGLAVLALACEGGTAGPAPSGGGSGSMAALGDSVTTAFASCLAPAPCPRNSWSTGDGTRIDSHYRRLLKSSLGLRGHNAAEGKARADALAAQARTAVAAKAGYVTILIGANDVCRPAVTDMTPVDTFRRQVDDALAVLKEGLPQARILVVSVPDIHRLWEIGHTRDVA